MSQLTSFGGGFPFEFLHAEIVRFAYEQQQAENPVVESTKTKPATTATASSTTQTAKKSTTTPSDPSSRPSKSVSTATGDAKATESSLQVGGHSTMLSDVRKALGCEDKVQ